MSKSRSNSSLSAQLKFAAIYLLIAIIVGLATKCFAQVAPKKTNRIIVNTFGNKDWNYDKVMYALIDQGYEIEKNEREFGIIKTALKPVKGLNASYYLYITTKDSTVTIKGNVIVNVSIAVGYAKIEPSYSDIENKGMKGSVLKESFAAMDLFAKELISKESTFYELTYLIE